MIAIPARRGARFLRVGVCVAAIDIDARRPGRSLLVYDAQVFLATHSPIVLSLLRSDQLLCFGKTASGAVDIVPGSQHPRLKEWKAAVHLGDLLATGVLG